MIAGSEPPSSQGRHIAGRGHGSEHRRRVYGSRTAEALAPPTAATEAQGPQSGFSPLRDEERSAPDARWRTWSSTLGRLVQRHRAVAVGHELAVGRDRGPEREPAVVARDLGDGAGAEVHAEQVGAVEQPRAVRGDEALAVREPVDAVHERRGHHRIAGPVGIRACPRRWWSGDVSIPLVEDPVIDGRPGRRGGGDALALASAEKSGPSDVELRPASASICHSEPSPCW